MKTTNNAPPSGEAFSKVSVNLPKALLEIIDRKAKDDRRSRTSCLIIALEKHFSSNLKSLPAPRKTGAKKGAQG